MTELEDRLSGALSRTADGVEVDVPPFAGVARRVRRRQRATRVMTGAALVAVAAALGTAVALDDAPTTRVATEPDAATTTTAPEVTDTTTTVLPPIAPAPTAPPPAAVTVTTVAGVAPWAPPHPVPYECTRPEVEWTPVVPAPGLDAVGVNGVGGVVYIRGSGNDRAVWWVSADGRTQHQLLAGGRPYVHPDLSRDGRWLLIDDGPQITVVDMASGASRAVTHCASSVTPAEWSPDGGRIVYVRHSTNRPEWLLYVMDADGSDAAPVIIERGVDVGMPMSWASWSPDGARLALGSGKGLFVNDGSRTVPLTDPNKGTVYSLQWQPEGEMIAFASADLYIVRSDGEDHRKVIDEPDTVGAVAWLPDGSRIVYQTYDEETRIRYILTIRPDGTDRTVLASGTDITFSFGT